MNRKDFLTKIGLAIGLSVVAPRVLACKEEDDNSTRIKKPYIPPKVTKTEPTEEILHQYTLPFWWGDLLQHKITGIRYVVLWQYGTAKGEVRVISCNPNDNPNYYMGTESFIYSQFDLVLSNKV
jgi:hypothetical protein